MSPMGLFYLGTPVVQLDQQPVELPTRKANALLAYLSVNAAPQTRDFLAALLWPELDHTRSRAALRQAIWMLGNTGLSSSLEAGQETVHLATGFYLDVKDFQEKLAAAQEHRHAEGEACDFCLSQLTEAAGLYRGDFLEGFSLPDSQKFDDWQLFQAESLRQAFAEVLERLVALNSAMWDWERGILYARRWIDLDVYNEKSHRALMRLYASNKNRGLAFKQYETLQKILDQELGVEPEDESRQLYADIQAGRFAGETGPGSGPRRQPDEKRSQTNLPTPLTAILGRDRELAQVNDQLLRPEIRLLTLLGPPGIGKTRLAIQVAADLLDQFEGRVWFIPLAHIAEADLLARTVTQTLGIIESGDRSAIAALKDFFRNHSGLLVLDNFEQIVAAAPLVAELLQSCPQLKILATSRAPLKISGERQYTLEPLELPELDRLPSVESLSTSPSIALFVARAGQVDPEFALNEANGRAVAQICHQLDGLPLAIELAAALVKLMPPQTLLARLSNRLSLLRGGPVDLPPRQRTLRAAIDWSYELLDSHEQSLLERLTVFVGGWTLEAAEAVVGFDGEADQAGSAEWVLEGLSSLVDKSLVKRQESRDGQLRFTMLETIYAYAAEKLVARGEQARLQRRHAAYYLQLAQAAEPALRGPDQGLWLARLKNEHNNLQVALRWALDNREAETAVKLAGSLWRYWWTHGHYREGRDWLEKALALPGSTLPAWRAIALNGLGVLARSQGDFANARSYLEACLELQRSLEDRAGVASVLNSLGVLAQYQQDYDHAYQFHEESLAHRRELGSLRDLAVSLNNLAMVAQEKQEYARAEDLYGESLQLFRQAGDARSIAAVLANRGSLMNDLGEAMQARDLFKESLLILRDLGQRDDIIECLEGFAGVAVLLKQFRRSARLLGAAEGLREAIGSPAPPYKRARYQRFKEKIGALLDLNLIAAERAAGKAMPLDAAIDYALLQDVVRDTATNNE